MEIIDPTIAAFDAQVATQFYNMIAQLLGLAPRLPEAETSVIHHGPFHGRDEEEYATAE